MDFKTNIEELKERAKGIKLFASDLDGTLFDSTHTLRDDTREALRALADRGVILVCATGRSRSSLPESITGFEGVKYLITANGARLFLRETDEVIYEKFLIPEAIEYSWPFLADEDVMCEFFWGGVPHVEEAHYNAARDYGIPKWFSGYFFSTRQPVRDFESAVREHINEIENINFIFGSEDVQARVHAYLLERTDLYELTSSFPFNYEIGGLGVGKGAAIDFIAKREGILPEQTICFGDQDNDAGMIEYAGIGVAMANATPLSRAAADIITLDNEHEGVLAALKAINLA